jgi:hypothetical protein
MASQAARKRLEAVNPDDAKTGDKTPEEGAVIEPDKLDAATSEVLDADDTRRIVSWHDLDLIVPTEIPPVLMFDFISMEDEQGAFSLMRMFLTLLGNDQFVLVRNVIGRLKPEEQVEAITELSDHIMSTYGTTSGESEASSDS